MDDNCFAGSSWQLGPCLHLHNQLLLLNVNHIGIDWWRTGANHRLSIIAAVDSCLETSNGVEGPLPSVARRIR